MTEQPSTLRQPLTDSPWFWFALFTAVGLAALLATGGKFGKRQANIENQFQARSAVASGTIDIAEDGSGAKRSSGVPRYSTPDDPVIPLWPLEVVLGLLFTGSFGLLLREQFRGRQSIDQPPR